MDEFFDIVTYQLNNEFNDTSRQQLLNRSLRFDGEESLCREESWSHFTHLSSNGKLTNQSKIKRRPLKSNSKILNKSKEDCFSHTQIISVNSEMKKIENQVLDKQLNRLEKTLNCSKNNNNPRYQRQKLLIRRLNIDKQNQQKPSKQANFVITSKFLQEIKDVNEQLYEISLNLYRFYQRQKQQNDRINEQIKQMKKSIQEKTVQLQNEKLILNKIEEQIVEEQRQQNKMQIALMRNMLIREYQ